MKPSTVKYFLYASLLFGLLVTSCSPELLKGFSKSDKPASFDARRLSAPCINPEASFFNMQIDFGKNHFSGMLICKQFSDTVYRAVFASHFGMSIFDFELTPNTSKVNYCMEAMNKDKVKGVLRDDLRALFLMDIPQQYKEKKYLSKTNDGEMAYKLKGNGKKVYLAFDAQGNLVKQARKAAIFTTNFTYNGCLQDTGAVISIRHKPIKLRFTLERLSADKEQVTVE